MDAIAGVYELGGNAKAITGFSNTALEDAVDVQPCPDLPGVNVEALECKGRAVSYHTQTTDLGEPVDELFRKPVTEVLIFRVRAEVGEGQNRDRRNRRRRFASIDRRRRKGPDIGHKTITESRNSLEIERVPRRFPERPSHFGDTVGQHFFANVSASPNVCYELLPTDQMAMPRHKTQEGVEGLWPKGHNPSPSEELPLPHLKHELIEAVRADINVHDDIPQHRLPETYSFLSGLGSRPAPS